VIAVEQGVIVIITIIVSTPVKSKPLSLVKQ
jgi:hypothetical protein